jgi:hypothetical protein
MGPVNIGSEEMVTINELVNMVSFLAFKDTKINHVPGPQVYEVATPTTV